MTHNNNAEIKLANGAKAGGVHISLRSPDVFQEPRHLRLPIVTAQKYKIDFEFQRQKTTSGKLLFCFPSYVSKVMGD